MRDVTTDTHASDEAGETPSTETPDTEQSASSKASNAGGTGRSRADWHDTMTVEGGGRRWGWMLGLVGSTAVLAVAGVLMAINLPGGTTLAGTSVASVDDAPAALQEAAGTLTSLPLRFSTDAGTELVRTGGDLGLTVDVRGTISPIEQGLPSISAWLRRLPSGPLAAPLQLEPYDGDVLTEVAAAVTAEPINAELDVRASGIDTTPGVDGLDVTSEDVRQALDTALDTIDTTDPSTWPETLEVTVSGSTVAPPVTQADIDAVGEVVDRLEAAEVVVTGEVILPADPEADEDEESSEERRGPQAITLSRSELRQLVDVAVDAEAPEGERLRLVPDPDGTPGRLVALMDLARVRPEVTAHVENRSPTPTTDDDPTDVSDITGDLVLDEVEPGFEPDREATLAQVIDAALAGGGQVEIVGETDSEVSLADMGIVEPISTFTSYYTAGQSRVQNIQRIAEIVDGVIVPAGEAFEVNHFVGRRTVENGFTVGGAILDGELVSDIGGGVSQFATTFFNAAWFAGIELVDFKAHSFYFSRYPPGREATINYPNVNLEIRNDTPYDILIDTDSNATSVTVTFWSTPYWDVQTVMGPCGCGGSFRITNERILTAPGGQPVTEEYTTTYSVPR